MQIVLSNGTILKPIMVTGATRFVQNANRDSLTFVFDESYGLDALDSIFTDANCESINIIADNGDEAIHTGYTVRAELAKKKVKAESETPEAEEIDVVRVFVTMAQRTYAESQLANLTDTVDVLVLESLLG